MAFLFADLVFRFVQRHSQSFCLTVAAAVLLLCGVCITAVFRWRDHKMAHSAVSVLNILDLESKHWQPSGTISNCQPFDAARVVDTNP